MKFNVICRLCGAVLAITCLGAVPQSYAAQEDTAVGVSAPSAADSGHRAQNELARRTHISNVAAASFPYS